MDVVGGDADRTEHRMLCCPESDTEEDSGPRAGARPGPIGELPDEAEDEGVLNMPIMMMSRYQTRRRMTRMERKNNRPGVRTPDRTDGPKWP